MIALTQEQVDNLKAEIIFHQARYDQAIKDGKLLRETKKMFKEIKALEQKLQQLISESSMTSREEKSV